MAKKLRQETLLDGDDAAGFDDHDEWSKDNEVDLRLVPARPKGERKASALRAIEERRERLRLRNELYDLHFDHDGTVDLD